MPTVARAIAGAPFTAGFFSKDLILWEAFSRGAMILWGIGLITAGLTAFYMFRQLFMVFHGEFCGDDHAKAHLHESPAVMTFPLVILAIGSIFAGWVGALAIIAVVTLLHGAIVMIPTWLWTLGVVKSVDPGWYRLVWWGLGHQSQQVNVTAMVSVWYFLAALTTGAKPLNQAVCRGAFVLYILFINLASAHHLLVDPGVSAGWKIWNTSYAMYLAVLASMIHGFTVPTSVESAMRAKGHDRGLFGWLTAAPWSNPAFSGSWLCRFTLPLPSGSL